MMNRFKNTKRIFAGLICLVLTLTMCVPMFQASAATGAMKGTDIMLVVDDTISMRTTDPNKLSAIAINKFVDKLPSGSDIKLGITTYAVNILPGSLAIGQTPQAIKDFAKNNITQSGRGTDTAMGLNWAVTQLKNGDPDRQKIIIIIGDGENDYIRDNPVRTDADSQKMLNESINTAKANGIKVYTLAINPVADTFRGYFSNIATSTGGTAYEPKTPADLDGVLDDIFTQITGATMVDNQPIDLDAGKPVTTSFDVPNGVFEMNLQCSHNQPLEIYFTDPNGTIFNESSAGVTYSKEATYTNCKIQEPEEGKWSVTYKSDVKQTVVPQFIFHADLTLSLSKNENDIMQQKPVQYIATLMAQGGEITDSDVLDDFQVNLIVTKLDKNGDPKGSGSKYDMPVKSGKFVLDHAIEDAGKYEVRAEIIGQKATIKSNVLTIDVAVDPSIVPAWQKIAIIAGIVLVLLILIILFISSRTRPGTGLVRGYATIKIVGRQANDEMMIFQPDKFDCEQIFNKKNTLTDLVSAYKKRYLINNSSELAEMSLAQFINSALTEVTDKVTICGNKKKQTIVTIPNGYDMQVDGLDIAKAKTYKFSAPEKAFELRFKNQGCSYTVNLTFTKA